MIARYHGKVTVTPQTDKSPDVSSVLRTDQALPHADLVKVVQHHRQKPWKKPCPEHTRAAFEQFLAYYQRVPRPLILDSFCGTGMSTALLAGKHPDKWVVGIDQSAHRLAKHPQPIAQNCLLFRAEAEPFWQCLTEASISLCSHWLLYPNPWPKASQFKRRVHGHGAFPVLADLGGSLEMRTNWGIFAQEFAEAAALIGCRGRVGSFTTEEPMTLFEKKYQLRGNTLWRFAGEFSD